MESEDAPRVLLGNLQPMMVVGLKGVLADSGCRVIGEEPASGRVVEEAERLQPDAVLLDRDGRDAEELGNEIRQVAPHAKVILWARDETEMEVLDPASRGPRVVALTAPGGLRNELKISDQRQRVED